MLYYVCDILHISSHIIVPSLVVVVITVGITSDFYTEGEHL